jgi:hypothetical protein
VTSFARIPHDAVPAIREAVRDRLLVIPAGPVDVAVLKARTADDRAMTADQLVELGVAIPWIQYCSIYCNTATRASRPHTVNPG